MEYPSDSGDRIWRTGRNPRGSPEPDSGQSGPASIGRSRHHQKKAPGTRPQQPHTKRRSSTLSVSPPPPPLADYDELHRSQQLAPEIHNFTGRSRRRPRLEDFPERIPSRMYARPAAAHSTHRRKARQRWLQDDVSLPSPESSEDSDDRNAFDFKIDRPADGSPKNDQADEVDQKAVSAAYKSVLSSGFYLIADSTYNGEEALGGIHHIELKTCAPQTVPLFRWVHLQDNDMIFGRFKERVSVIPGLDGFQRRAVDNLLLRVRKRFDRQLPEGESWAMQPSVLSEPIIQDSKKRHPYQMVTWMCLPYFCLQRYAKGSSEKGSHPIRAMLQTLSSSEQQSRDLQQAISRLTHTPRGECFHVAQVWYLVIGESLLVTCGQITRHKLKSEAVSITPLVPRSPRILVYYKKTVVWAIEVEETWFEFMLNFVDFWPEGYRLSFKGTPVTPEHWPQILSRATHGKEPIRLDFELRDPAPPKMTMDLPTLNVSVNDQSTALGTSSSNQRAKKAVTISKPGPDSKDHGDTTNVKLSQETGRAFSVFLWINSEKSSRGIDLNKKRLEQNARKMDLYLRDLRTIGSLYRQSPKQHHTIVKNWIAHDVKSQVGIFNSLEEIVQFFVPLEIEADIVLKFWGAVEAIVKSSQEEEYNSAESLIGYQIDTLVRLLRPIHNLLDQASGPMRYKIELPDDIVNSWLHLVSALVCCAAGSDLWEDQMQLACNMLEKGILECARRLSRPSLLKKSVLMPMHLASLLSLHLIHDVTPQRDVDETYSEYLNVVESEMGRRPSKRSHQETLMRFDQEVSAVQSIVSQQQKVLADFGGSKLQREFERIQAHDRLEIREERYRREFIPIHPALASQDARQLKLSPTDPGGYFELLLRDGLLSTEKRLRHFEDMANKAERLGKLNILQIESYKDGQERAIYIFTVVTIIFLPLSTVAGILGMNTNDVRNMDLDQWVFWATAIPLLVIILIVCVVVSGRMEPILEKLRKAPIVRRTSLAREK